MYKRGNIWWTRIYHEGQEIRVSLKTSNKATAKNVEAKIRLAIAQGEHLGLSIFAKKTVADMLDKFMRDHAPKVSANTRKSYTYSIKHLLAFFENIPCARVTPKMIARYKHFRIKQVERENEKRADEGKKAKELKPATLNRELACLSKAFNLAAYEWEWIKSNPIAMVKMDAENNKRTRWLSSDEETKLLEHSPQWFREVIVFDIETGLRKSELIALEWSDVDRSRKTVFIRDSKNGEQRTIPLSARAFAVLERVTGFRSIDLPYVFLSPMGKQLMPRNLLRSLSACCRKAGIEDFRFHDLRHTYATRLSQKGIDIFAISRLLGHKDIRMSQRYMHHNVDSLRDILEKADDDRDLGGIKK